METNDEGAGILKLNIALIFALLITGVPSYAADDLWTRDKLTGHYYHHADDYVDLVGSIPGQNLRDDSWSFEAYYNLQTNL